MVFAFALYFSIYFWIGFDFEKLKSIYCYLEKTQRNRLMRPTAVITICKYFKVLLQPLWWRCVECVIHHEQDVREEQQYIYVARTSNNRVIAAHDLYCCLLPQCEALCTCRSCFSDGNTMVL